MRFLADENFDNDILRGILREHPGFDVIRVQDTEIYKAEDAVILAWSAQENRILLTHDVNTLVGLAYERVVAGLRLPGVIEVNKKQMSIGEAITELILIDGAGSPDEFENQVTYLPLR